MTGDTEQAEERFPLQAATIGSRRRQWNVLLLEPGTALGLFLVVSLLLAGLLAPWLPLDDPTEINLPERLLSPRRSTCWAPTIWVGTPSAGSSTERA